MNKKILAVSGILLFLLTGYFWVRNEKSPDIEEKNSETEKTGTIKTEINQKPIEPIREFEKRITKKPFGIFITPENSPVQPERFGGFHTGVDVEFEDSEDEIEVKSICAGEVVLKRWVSGYGGTVVVKCQKDGHDYYLLYGHLKNDSITTKTEIETGEKLGILGKGGTIETDYERKHLHFSIHKNTLDLKGYVQNQSELSNWIDPEKQELFL